MSAEPELMIEKIVSGRQARSKSVKTTEIKEGAFKGLKIHEGEAPGELPEGVVYTDDPKWPHAALHAKVKITHHGPLPGAPVLHRGEKPVEKPVVGIRAPMPKPMKKIVFQGLVGGKITHYYEDGTKEEQVK